MRNRTMMVRSVCAILLIGTLALAGIQGCAAPLQIGYPPRVDRLDQLKPHVSTKQDVLLTLGEPRGYGAARLDPTFPRQQVWLYEYTVSDGRAIRFTMLLVFFSQEAYDGHMWFADATNLKKYQEKEP